MTPDVNVLIAATRSDHDHHAAALRWFDAALAGATRAAPFTLLPVVAVGYVRVVTNRRAFRTPTPTGEAITTLAELLAAPHVRLAPHGDEWPRFAALCEKHAPTGNDVTDMWIAVAALQLNEHLVTFDRGFRRYLPPRHLTVLTP